MSEPSRHAHPFAPICDENSRVLVLGTFPSVKSRRNGFYYAHPQNRFWKVAAAVFGEPLPQSRQEKELLLLRNRVALWDVLSECEVTGSDDSSIRNEKPNNISGLIRSHHIAGVFLNGKKAYSLYKKHFAQEVPAVPLPSTSPANAAYTLERLIEEWGALRTLIDGARNT